MRRAVRLHGGPRRHGRGATDAGKAARDSCDGVGASMREQYMAWPEPDRLDNWSRRLGGRATRGAERKSRIDLVRGSVGTSAATPFGGQPCSSAFAPTWVITTSAY